VNLGAASRQELDDVTAAHAARGDDLEVVHGLKPGERVVTEGSFYLRAEAGRQRASD